MEVDRSSPIRVHVGEDDGARFAGAAECGALKASGWGVTEVSEQHRGLGKGDMGGRGGPEALCMWVGCLRAGGTESLGNSHVLLLDFAL